MNIIHHPYDYTDRDIKSIKKWTNLAVKEGVLVERTAWLEEMIGQGNMFSVRQDKRVMLFFLLRVLFVFNQAKVGVAQNAVWRHPHFTYGPMTRNAIIECSQNLGVSVLFIAVYKHNEIANTIFCDDTLFRSIEFSQVNQKIFTDSTFQPDSEKMILKYYTSFDKSFLTEKNILI